MPTQYKQLSAGDIRQEGDEWNYCDLGPGDTGFVTGFRRAPYRPSVATKQHPVTLIGHVILVSDLMCTSFRRPL